MNTDAEMLNKIFNPTPWPRRIYSRDMQEWFKAANPSVIREQNWGQKSNPQNRWRKSIWQNSTSFHDKYSHHTEQRKNTTWQNKGRMWQAHSWHAEWAAASAPSPVGSQRTCRSRPARRGKSSREQLDTDMKRHSNPKGRSEMVSSLHIRWHIIYRKP